VQQSLFIADGAGSNNVANVNTTAPGVSDPGLIVRPIDPAEGSTGSAIPTTAILLGASDGTNLQQLLVESSSNRNLRAALYDGTSKAQILNTTPSGTEYGLAVRIVGAAAGGTSSTFGSSFPSSGTAAGFNDGTNMQAARVFDTDTGAGTQYVLGVNLRSSSSGGSIEFGTNSNPLFNKLTDGTNNITVKAASTAALATDTALVVAISPNNSASTKEVRSSASSVTSVASSASNVTLLATNSNRLGATIYNDSSKNLYIKLGATASTTSFTTIISSMGYYEVPFNYTGQIDGIWAAANGNARITELT